MPDLRFRPNEDRTRLLVTYERSDGLVVCTKEGRGKNIAQALFDADSQLRPGVWTRLVVSSRGTILDDLQRKPPAARRQQRHDHGEGAIVRIHESEVRSKGGENGKGRNAGVSG